MPSEPIPPSTPPHLPVRSKSTLSSGPPSDATSSDHKAVSDVYKQVESTGSLELAAKKLQQLASAGPSAARPTAARPAWADDPEEAAYIAQTAGGYDESALDDGDGEMLDEDEDEGEEDMGEIVHMQEVVDGLWVGDLVAAMDQEGLEERGIGNILSLLRPKLKFAPSFAVFPLEVDDSADTDILSHLPTCVAWIGEALRRREEKATGARATSTAKTAAPEREKTLERLPQTKPAGVLVHCQAGMSRSATVAAAYLIRALGVDEGEAVEMVREKRPVIDPSETFWHQLALFANSHGKVSLRDRSTRQFYMERTASHFMNGDGGAPPMDKMAKYPATPTPSNPPTPSGGHGRRKIRCKMCRRHLAVREHMMDHILEQAPISRPRTPSNFALPSPINTSALPDRFDRRRSSTLSDVINPLTGLPGARSRHASMSSGQPSPVQPLHEHGGEGMRSNSAGPAVNGLGVSGAGAGANGTNGINSLSVPVKESKASSPKKERELGSIPSPLPRTSTPGLILTSGSVGSSTPSGASTGSEAKPDHAEKYEAILASQPLVPSPQPLSRKSSLRSLDTPAPRTFQTADQLASRLPPHLLALRAGAPGVSALTSPIGSSPGSSPERETAPSVPFPVPAASHTFPPSGGAAGAARRLSLLAMTPTEGRERSGSAGGSAAGSGGGSDRQRRTSGTGSGGGYGYGYGYGGEIASSGPPILVNPRCSGYFVEPLTWMEPILANGDISGKILCPNEKCSAKIGNFDWAGVQCGCKEWVTPGFCIHRSKVDEVW